MRKCLLAVMSLVLLPVFSAAAQKYELGVIAGEPTGVSAKLDLKDGTALDAAMAWSFSGKDELTLHADKLWYRHGVFSMKEGRMPLYYGVGARIKTEKKSLAGVRLPVGAQYFLKDSRLTFFGEIAPILDLVPDTELRFSVALGFRVIFR